MKDYTADIRDYLARLQDMLNKISIDQIDAIAKLLQKAYDEDRTIIVMGNGGSGSTASHMVCDINKGACFTVEKKFRVISLADNIATILALGNDVNFDSIFVEQLKNHARPGDVVIGISGSGNSRNVLCAIEYAKKIGCTTVGVTGFEGGKLKPLVDHNFHVAINDMQIVEDVHMILVHILMRLLMQNKQCACC
mgnify:CR=1 FL=1